MSQELTYSVTDFVAICNQVLDLSFGSIRICGELANFKISKNRWVYFDLKDDYSSLRFFGSIYDLPGPLQDGMLLTVTGVPQLHPKFGFNISFRQISLSGEGSIKKAAKLLEQKLSKEGLFAVERKRILPYPPTSIGLVTSLESAAYADFMKIINNRWSGLSILFSDVQVQGDNAAHQIIQAIDAHNKLAKPPEVLVIIRGGGSADDLQSFNNEQLVRSVAASRVPTLVAIGHETDLSLAEMAADQRASTPSNAAELLVPDKNNELVRLEELIKNIDRYICQNIADKLKHNKQVADQLMQIVNQQLQLTQNYLDQQTRNLDLLNPDNVLKRGYAMVRQNNKFVQNVNQIDYNSLLSIKMLGGIISAKPIHKENDDL